MNTYHARLYGLARDKLCYILDPKQVHGEDFPGETFRELKEKEVKQFGDASQSGETACFRGVGRMCWS